MKTCTLIYCILHFGYLMCQPFISHASMRNTCWRGVQVSEDKLKNCHIIYSVEVTLPVSMKEFYTDKIWLYKNYIFTSKHKFIKPDSITNGTWKVDIPYTSEDKIHCKKYAPPSKYFKLPGLLRYIENGKRKYLKIERVEMILPQ